MLNKVLDYLTTIPFLTNKKNIVPLLMCALSFIIATELAVVITLFQVIIYIVVSIAIHSDMKTQQERQEKYGSYEKEVKETKDAFVQWFSRYKWWSALIPAFFTTQYITNKISDMKTDYKNFK